MQNKPFYREPSFYVIFSSIMVAIIALQCATFTPTADELTAPDIHHFVAPPLTLKDEFKAEFGDHSGVYDGDTWTDIYITIKTLENGYLPEVLWPGVFLTDNTLYVVTDIRIKHLDTAEKRPTKAGRTPESLAREKAAAQLAKDAVEQLLEANDWEFVVTEPELGKYAGRTLANILIGKDRINLADYLIDRGLGYEYTGGKKKAFDSWYQDTD